MPTSGGTATAGISGRFHAAPVSLARRWYHALLRTLVERDAISAHLLDWCPVSAARSWRIWACERLLELRMLTSRRWVVNGS